MSKLTRFGVYHPEDGKLNDNCSIDVAYKYVTSVLAENLLSSVSLASGFNPDYRALGKRSTERGDIIIDHDKVYMIISSGFRLIPKSKQLYKDLIQTDEAIIEILSRQTLTQDDIDELIDNCY